MNDLSKQIEPGYELPDYRFLRPLGRGRWAYVYLATQLSLNRPVAVKVLTNTDKEFLTRFEREAEVMATVSHPNIVSVIDRGVMDKQHFIVMEFMDGGSLRDRMAQDHPMDLAAARKIICAVANALTCLHGMGLIHRDVKPDNVLFDRQERIKLCDFGIAAPLGQIGELTDANASPGTVDYMAPEQRHRLGVSREADQFAMAVMAYEILTGKLPTQIFRLASARNPLLGASVDAVLERALQEQPEARFPNVAAFAAALDAALDEKSSLSEPSNSVWLNPKVLLSSVVAIVLCAMLLYWMPSSDIQSVTLPDTSVPGGSPDLDRAGLSTGHLSANAEPIQQTGALTYRLTSDDEVEVLVVTARTGGHWTIPKANQKPEDTLSSVAEAEAFEEAGVRGKAVPIVIGDYSYSRNGKSYRVSVVPVRFTEELSDWPEATRDRRWGATHDTSAIVASDKLREIIDSFSIDAVR